MGDIVMTFLITLIAVLWWLSGRQKGLPPGPGFALPIVGHLYLLSKDPMAQIEKWRKQYGNMYMLKFGSQPTVLIHEYSIMHEALIKNHDVFIDRSETFLTKTLLQNKGIFSLKGEAWKEQRTFVHSVLRDLGMGKNVMAERIHDEVKHYLKAIDESTGEPTDLSNLINTSVCNVICGVVFGKRFSHKDEKFLKLLDILDFLFRELSSSAAIQFFPFLRHLPGDYFLYHESTKRLNEMKSVLWEMINKDGRKINVNDETHEDLVQAYLTEIERKKDEGVRNTSIDDHNLLATVVDFFNAGTDTTSKTITFGLLYLVNFQDIQEKLFQEIKDNVGTDRLPQISDKSALKYLQAFISETLRYAKLGPFVPDRIANKNVMIKGFLIPKGTVIIPVNDSLSWNQDVWGDPGNFRPERFLDESKKELPIFSLGKRNCLGEALAVMELFLFFSAMIQRFQFLPEVDGEKPSLESEFGFIRTPAAFKVRALPRKDFSDPHFSFFDI